MLLKRIEAKAAEQQVPPRMAIWIDRNQKVMKEMAKFMDGRYAGHIVTGAQCVKMVQTPHSFPKAVTNICGQKHVTQHVWTLQCARQPQVSPGCNETCTNNQAVTLGPEESPLMTFGFPPAQMALRRSPGQTTVESGTL